MKIVINDNTFYIWACEAWKCCNDGLDRGFWFNPKTNTTTTTCETKNTEHNPTGELILIGWVKGDNNMSMENICEGCGNHNKEYPNNCEDWELWKKQELRFTDDPDPDDMRWDCMDNVGFMEDFKKQCLDEINTVRKINNLDEIEIEWR